MHTVAACNTYRLYKLRVVLSINPSSKADRSCPAIPPYLALAFAILAVSASSIFIRLAQAEASSLVIAAYRLSISTLILSVPVLFRNTKEIALIKPKQWGLLILSGFFLALHFASWITSLEYTSIASSVVLVTSSPLWVAIFSPVLLKERIPKSVRWGLAIAMLGAVLVGSASYLQSGSIQPMFSGGKALWGQFLALCGAVTVAGYFMIGRSMRQSLSLLSYTFLVYGIAAVILLLIVWMVHLPLGGYSPHIYLLFAAMAVIPQLLGHSTLNWALKYIPAAIVSIVTLGEPVGATLLGYLILKESPQALEVLGGIIILIGIAVAMMNGKPERTLKATSENYFVDSVD